MAVIWLPNGYFGKFHMGVPQYFIMQSPKDRKMAHTHGHSMSGAPSVVSRCSDGKSVAQYYLRGKIFTEIAFTVFSEAGGTVASSAAASFVKQVVTHDTTAVISKTCYLGIGLLGRPVLSSVNKQIKLDDRLEQ